MPRPRLGESPMTPAERQAKRRQQYRAMQDKIARLRDALNLIATHPEAHIEGAADEMQAIAREALAETEQ